MQYNLKNIKMLSFAALLALIVGLGSCTDDFEAVNTDNTKLSTVSTAEFPYMFSNALMSSTLAPNNFEIGEGTYAGVYSQFYSQAAMSFPTDRYVMRLDWLPAAWNPIYIQSAPALKTILENTDEKSPENALAKIWWVWMFHRVTDYFGPIPYTQAANGLGSVASTPQDSIYYDFFKKLDAASAVLKSSAGTAPYGKFDLIYNAKGTAGASAAWMKFANTLRLRLALRISKVDPATAKTQAEAAVAAGVMTETTDDAFMPKSNTVYAEYNGLSQIVAWDEIRMSSTMESILKGYDDPRMPIYFQPASFTGKYDGVRNGLLVAEKQMDINSRKYTSNLGSRWATGSNGSFTAVFNTPQNILHAAEAYFLRAEGALNGWNMGDNAQNLYETGIKMSMKQWGITDQAVIAKYIANPAVPIAPQDGQNSPPVNDYPAKFSADPTMQRKQVAQQKWLALFPDAMEGWAEVRRSGLPKLYPIVHSENTDLPEGTFIRRVPFLDSEKQTNADETAKAVQMLKGPDKVSTPLWWDKN